MTIFNNAINPKGEADFSASLMPVRAKRIKTVKVITKGSTGGASQVSNGTVYIPTGETAEDRIIRFHEALHVAHTKSGAKFKDMLDQALEDARLHRYCSKASQSQFQQARRDELTVALRDLRNVGRNSYELSPRASLAVLRSLGILQSALIAKTHARLLDKVLAKLGPNAKADFSRAVDMLAKCNGDTSTKTWKAARKIVQDYFKSDFEGQEDKQPQLQQLESDSTESDDDARSQDGQSAETLPQDSDESDDEPEESDSKDASKSDDSKDEDESDSDSESGSDSDDSKDDSDDDADDSDSTDSDKSEDSEEDSKDESESDEPGEGEEDESETEESEIAPAVEEPKKLRAKKSKPEEYTADLTPECDKDEFEKRNASCPLKIYIRRLDMAINRVKLDMGRHKPTPTTNGRNILARKLAAAVTTPGTRVFSRPVNQGGFGTILIDASGSMSIPEATLMDFLSKAPALTLAFYNAKNDRVQNGNIFIYAANGYRASTRVSWNLEYYGSGNVIDYHAMAWLIKQPAPHYLVTDRGWTGYWRNDSDRLCSKLTASGQIVVVPDLESMSAILDRKGRK